MQHVLFAVPHKDIAPFRFIDLFAGIGGFHHALAELGGECVMACEIDESARRVYLSQFPDTPMVNDIRSITRTDADVDRSLLDINKIVPDHDVLCGGFPCQPFSKSGFQHGTRDKTRGTLFFDIMEIVRAKKPKYLILENVRNLAGPKHKDTWKTIIESIRIEGYSVSDTPLIFSPHLIPPALGGAPQTRDRVFILAMRDGSAIVQQDYEPIDGWKIDEWNIYDYLEDDTNIPNIDRYKLKDEELGWLEAWDCFIKTIKSDWLPGFPIWVDAFKQAPKYSPEDPDWKINFLIKNSEFYVANKKVIDLWLKMKWGPKNQTVMEFPPSRRSFEWQARKYQKTAKQRNLWDLVMHFRPSGIRVKPPTYLPALVAITQTSIIGARKRRITPIEAAKLQCFPNEYCSLSTEKESELYKQLGNAVNVGVVRYLAKRLLAHSNNFRGSAGGHKAIVDRTSIEAV